MGFCPPCQIKQWAFVQWDIVQWAFVLVGFCPSGLCPFPIPETNCLREEAVFVVVTGSGNLSLFKRVTRASLCRCGCQVLVCMYVHNTPASNLGYLAPPPPRTIFHGCQIVHWDPLDGKRRCPQKNFGLGYVKLHGFYANP